VDNQRSNAAIGGAILIALVTIICGTVIVTAAILSGGGC
jgi:hypothetical protein